MSASEPGARPHGGSLDLLGEAALYLDFYGVLLSGRQAEVLDAYYNENYSITEIAAGLSISRQAAHDALRAGALALMGYEEKLGLAHAYRRDMENADAARGALAQLRGAISEMRASAAKRGGGGSDCGRAAVDDDEDGTVIKVDEAVAKVDEADIDYTAIDYTAALNVNAAANSGCNDGAAAGGGNISSGLDELDAIAARLEQILAHGNQVNQA